MQEPIDIDQKYSVSNFEITIFTYKSRQNPALKSQIWTK